MINVDHHIIRRQVIELALPSRADAYRQQRHVSELFQQEVARRLGTYFDELDLGETVLRIPKLEVDLGVLSSQGFDEQFIEQCTRAIKREVENRMQQAKLSSTAGETVNTSNPPLEALLVPAAKEALATLREFLLSGVLPPVLRKKRWEELEAMWGALLTDDPVSLLRLLQSLAKQSGKGIQRLLLQFSHNWIRQLVGVVTEELDLTKRTGVGLLAKRQGLKISLPPSLRKKLPWWEELPLYFQELLMIRIGELTKSKTVLDLSTRTPEFVVALFKVLLLHPIAQWEKAVPQVLEQLLPQQTAKEKLATQPQVTAERASDSDNDLPSDQEAEHLYVTQAGLVILHPFMVTFFQQLGYLEDKKWKNQQHQERAMHTLVYLSSGEEHFSEHSFLLPKVFVGWPIELPVNRHLQLTDTERTEADRLLAAVLRHWTALKSNSIQGLREAFLQREGVLDLQSERAYKLIVERKGQDVLLDKLPWGIGLMKLPWMEQQMNVEWCN